MGNGETSNTVNVVQSRGFNWGIVIQILTIVVIVTLAWASLETKPDALVKMETLRKENKELYMPRELSLEKWKTNDESHATLQRSLDENNRLLNNILIELRKEQRRK